MNWLTSLRDQLPLLLVVSPLVGFVGTCVAAVWEPRLIRHLALSNMLCTLAILGGMQWQFETDLATETEVIRLAARDLSSSQDGIDSLTNIRRTLDRMRSEQIQHQWFCVDGVNLFPLLLVVSLVIIVVWRTDCTVEDSRWFVPTLMLFEAGALGVLTASDVRLFLFASTASAVVMSLLIGRTGSTTRRNLAEQFLLTQFCGGVLISLGFAMLVVSVPWMKIPDSTAIPKISWNVASLAYDIQKWMARSEPAFHYASDNFPWMLLLLSLGFAVQSGLFPFHQSQIRIVSDSHPAVAALYLAGSLSASRIAWLRFVLPLAPDLLSAFDRWILIPSILGAVWGTLCAQSLSPPRQRSAYALMALFGLSLLGCFTFTRMGMNGAWLMQQQLTALSVLCLLAMQPRGLVSDEVRQGMARPRETSFRARTLVLMLCLPLIGLFVSGYLIVSDLFIESLPLVGGAFLVGLLIARTVLSLLNQQFLNEQRDHGGSPASPNSMSGHLVVLTLLLVVTCLFPSLLLHQCNSEFARVFRRFEQSNMAESAETHSEEPQHAP